MLNFLIYILSCFGLTLIVTDGHIFEPIRKKTDKLFNYNPLRCHMCSGFWDGLFLYYYFFFLGINLSDSLWMGPVFAFAASGTSYVLASLIGDNGLKIEKWTKN